MWSHFTLIHESSCGVSSNAEHNEISVIEFSDVDSDSIEESLILIYKLRYDGTKMCCTIKSIPILH